jgi:hypothetical protein
MEATIASRTGRAEKENSLVRMASGRLFSQEP